MRAKAIALLFVCALAPAAVLAVSTASENWSLFEQGNAAMAQREFGKALSLYKEAILKAGIFPEAEVAVGDVYAEEGESTLALAQYEKAYNVKFLYST